ncbi:MAG: transcriptional repressor [Bacilli bacterium]|nr:transcriptional repressor [Bacilli bacterium]
MKEIIGKNTKHRKNLLEILNKAEIALSVEDIYQIMVQNGDKKLALSTVYRNMNVMVESGQVSKVFDELGTALYKVNSHIHSHQLECQKCHKKVVIDVCPYDLVQNTILKDKDFTIVENTALLQGYCKGCLPKV